MIPVIFNRFSLRTEKTISKILHKMTVSNKCLFTLQGKWIFHQTSYELVRREDKCEVKPTRSSNQRPSTIEWPDEGMVDDMDPSTERRCAINRNENAKVINIDVSDVIKLLKYMHAGISRFFKPNNIHEKCSRFWLKHSVKKENTVLKRSTSKTPKQNTFWVLTVEILY
jgi:hypothetical protein